MTDRFWETKSLVEMSAAEWESLCDGCARCCLHRFESEETQEVVEVAVACRLLDLETCRCSDYQNRSTEVPTCLVLSPETIADHPWLPQTCAYKRLERGENLPVWHHLMCGSRERVHTDGPGVRGRVVSERDADPMDALLDLIDSVS